MLGSGIMRTTLAAYDEKRRRSVAVTQHPVPEPEIPSIMLLAPVSESKERRKSAPLIAVPCTRVPEPGCSDAIEEGDSSDVQQVTEELKGASIAEERTPPPQGSALELFHRRDSERSRFSRSHSFKGKRNSTSGIELSPHKYTDDPLVAWEMLKNNRPVKPVRQMKANTPVRQDAVRFVCMACLHQLFPEPRTVPPGDVLIIAGDFTLCGRPDEIELFSKYLEQLEHTFKVVIAGNHECTFDDHFMKATGSELSEKEFAVKQTLNDSFSVHEVKNAKAKLKNAFYLEDSSVELFGVRIYGTPWLPQYDSMAFNLPRGQALLDKWNNIPTGVDVLITHTPPLGHGDLLPTGLRGGCVELLNSVVKRIRPKYHVFGHIHSGYGCTTDGYTKFINCSLVDDRLRLTNNPVIFDVPTDADTKRRWLNKYRRAGYA